MAPVAPPGLSISLSRGAMPGGVEDQSSCALRASSITLTSWLNNNGLLAILPTEGKGIVFRFKDVMGTNPGEGGLGEGERTLS